MKPIRYILLGITILVLAAGGQFLADRYNSSVAKRLGATNITDTPVALFETSLASGITSTQTTMTLVSGLTQDGTTLASSTYGFIIDQGSANQEFVRADCTNTTCTNMSRGISVITGTSTIAALQFSHRRGASIKITDAPILLQINNLISGYQNLPNILSYNSAVAVSTTSNQIPTAIFVSNLSGTASTSVKSYADTTFLNKTASGQTVSGNNTYSGILTFSGTPVFSALTINGIGTFNVPPVVPYDTASTSAVSNGRLADISFAGTVNASLTQKGIIQIANNTQAASSTPIGSTAALLVLPASMSTSTSQTATTSIVATLFNGKIDNSFIDASSTAITAFGPGTDGDVTIASNSTTTLTRDMYYNNLTVSGVIVMNNWRIFVKETLSGAGTIKSNGAPGPDGQSSTQAGSAPSATTTGYFIGCPGGSGGAGGSNTAGTPAVALPLFSGPSFTSSLSGLGGTGGVGGSGGGGAGAAIGANTGTSTNWTVGSLSNFLGAFDTATSTGVVYRLRVGNGGTGGGGGGSQGGVGGGGGSGGECGGVAFVAAKIFSGSVAIQSLGGKGGTGNGAVSSTSGGGGGGGGGKGGVVARLFYTDLWSGTCTVTGGPGGVGGAPNGGSIGDTGSSGGTGQCYTVDIRNLIR